jgi:hypothetical protein
MVGRVKATKLASSEGAATFSELRRAAMASTIRSLAKDEAFGESFNDKARDELFAREVFDSVFAAALIHPEPSLFVTTKRGPVTITAEVRPRLVR